MLSSMVHDETALPVKTSIQLLQIKRGWLRFFTGLLCGLLLVWSNSLWQLKHLVDITPVHQDQTYVIAPVKKQVISQVKLIYQNQKGELVQVLADSHQYSTWVKLSITHLEQMRKQFRQQAESAFRKEMNTLFATVKLRIPEFSNWYFSLTTNYALLWEAVTSGLAHFGNKEAVIADLEKVFNQHYQLMVLKPEITDAQIKQLYLHQLQQNHQAYLLVLSEMTAEFQVFVSKQNPDVESEQQPLPELHLDWISQLQKWQSPEVHATVGAAFRGLGLTTFGWGIGREMGTIVGTRLMMPFVERGIIIIAGGGSGSVAGPVGATVGLMLGFGADWLLQYGIKLASQDAFQHDVEAAVNATEAELTFKLLPSILQTIDGNFDDTEQLLLKFHQN